MLLLPEPPTNTYYEALATLPKGCASKLGLYTGQARHARELMPPKHPSSNDKQEFGG